MFSPILYVPDVLDVASDVLCAYCVCISSCWFLIMSSGVLNKTLSPMCSSLYSPMFLFRRGLFTLIKMAALIVLAKFGLSLPTVLKLSNVLLWPVLDWQPHIGDQKHFSSDLMPQAILCDWQSLTKSR